MLTVALFPILLPLACFVLLAVCWPLRHKGRIAGVLSSGVAIASCLGALVLLNRVLDGTIGATNGFEATVPWLVMLFYRPNMGQTQVTCPTPRPATIYTYSICNMHARMA